MIIFLTGLLLLAVILFVGDPLWKSHRGRKPKGDVSDRLGEFAQRRERILSQIEELELEHQMGKLSTADYQAMRNRLLDEAVALMDQMDRLQRRKKALREQIEKEIQAYRRSKTPRA